MPQAMMNVPLPPRTPDGSNGRLHTDKPIATLDQGGPSLLSAISSMKSTCVAVEQLLVENELLLAETTAAAAVEGFTKTLAGVTSDAIADPASHGASAMLSFWRLVTLLVQARLAIAQNNDSNVGSQAAGSPSSPQSTPREDLTTFLPRLFDRLESTRRGSVPPATRLLHAQVLRVLGMTPLAAQYLESQVLPAALSSQLSASEDEKRASGDPILSPCTHLNHYNNGGGGDGANGKKGGRLGYAADKPNGDHGSIVPDTVRTGAPSSPKAVRHSDSRAARLFNWTPTLLLAAVDLYFELRFEAAATGSDLPAQAPQGQSATVTTSAVKRLQDAEVRCIDFVSANSLALSRCLRSSVTAEAGAAHSVLDVLLSRVQIAHSKALQAWSKQQQQQQQQQSIPTKQSNGASRPPQISQREPPQVSEPPPQPKQPVPVARQRSGREELETSTPLGLTSRLRNMISAALEWWGHQPKASRRMFSLLLPLLVAIVALLAHRLQPRAVVPSPARRQLTF